MTARAAAPIVCPMTPLLAPTRAAHRTVFVPTLRRIHNPVQRDWVTFLETSDETGGLRTVVYLTVSPNGGNALHTHRSYAEHFTVLEGSLGVQVGRRVTVLGRGEAASAPAGVAHRWFNPGTRPARVLVTLTDGHAGFEQALRVAYGLARDGLVDGRGVPRCLRHLALLLDLSDTEPTGPGRLLAPALRALARRARAEGVERELVARYCGAW
jgi:quercetin dioxygenase-like cupin family protein